MPALKVRLPDFEKQLAQLEGPTGPDPDMRAALPKLPDFERQLAQLETKFEGQLAQFEVAIDYLKNAKPSRPLTKAEAQKVKGRFEQLLKRYEKVQENRTRLQQLKAKLKEHPLAQLDKALLALLAKHDLQDVMESLRRIATEQVILYEDGTHSLPKSKWGKAHTILLRADSALYAQHCGDVRPKQPGTRIALKGPRPSAKLVKQIVRVSRRSKKP